MLREKQILKRKEKKEKQKTNLIKKFSTNTNITPILDTDGDNKVLDAKYDLIEKNIKDKLDDLQGDHDQLIKERDDLKQKQNELNNELIIIKKIMIN